MDRIHDNGTDGSMGPIANIVVGIIGAVVGGFVMSLIGYGGVDGFNVYSIVVAILGAIIVIWLVKAIA